MSVKGMKAYVLDLGSLKADMNMVIAGLVQATASNPNPNAIYSDLPCYSVLIDHPTAGKILYDLGCSRDACPPNEHWPKEQVDISPVTCAPGQNMTDQLALCGTRPQDISTVLLSHLHWDHTGALYLFENCDVYTAEKDLQYGMARIHCSTYTNDSFPYYKHDLNVPVKHFWGVLDEEEDIEFFPGVHLINLPGHAPGVLGLLLELSGGNIFFPSDACYTARNLDRTAGIVYDSLEYMKSLRKIKKYANKYQAKIMFMHDADFFEHEMKKAPACYE